MATYSPNPKVLHSERDYRDMFTLTTSDTVNIAADPLNVIGYPMANGIIALTAGTITFATPTAVAQYTSGEAVAIVPVVTGSVLAGTIINCDVMRVYDTGTTANVAALIR